MDRFLPVIMIRWAREEKMGGEQNRLMLEKGVDVTFAFTQYLGLVGEQ